MLARTLKENAQAEKALVEEFVEKSKKAHENLSKHDGNPRSLEEIEAMMLRP